MRLDLLDRLHVDQRPDHRTGSNPSATFIVRPSPQNAINVS
jgi:hypothetical protein